jgi:hypothetical protein
METPPAVSTPICPCIKKNLGRILTGQPPVGLVTGSDEEDSLVWHICKTHRQTMLFDGTSWNWKEQDVQENAADS